MSPKLIYSPNNHLCLKSLLALELSGAAHKIVVEELQSVETLSALKISEEQILVTENEICRFILGEFNGTPNNSEVDQWLEWESDHLQPMLEHFTGGSSAQAQELKKIDTLLAHLDTSLKDKSYFTEENLSAADVVVWVSLYLIANNSNVVSKHINGYPRVSAWFNRLADEPAFRKVLRLTSSCKENGPETKMANCSVSSEQVAEENESEVTPDEIAEAVKAWTAGQEAVPLLRVRSHPILPVEGEKNVLITSSLPYVNNVPHLGNIIGCVLSADVYARYCRLRNYNTLYICGTDEYGTATETKALEEGVTPQEICDKYYVLHADIYKWFEISFDYFGRTTTQKQTEIAQDFFWRLHTNGYLTADAVEQLFCPKCSRFLADRFVEGICPHCTYDDARGDQCDKCGKLLNAVELKQPRCKVCQTEPVMMSSNHLFLDLPALQEKVDRWLEKTSRSGHWSPSAKVISRSWIKDGLKPRCITRDLKWGTPVPLEGFQDKVFYVWYDAPIGYLSITANYTEHWKKWWNNPEQVQLYQFMAKDNVPFHAIIFPSCELGANDNYTIVSHLSATEYLNYEDGKFSKSRGVGVFGNDAQDTGIPADIWRFYLLYVRPESQDSAFCWSDLMTKNNSELLNNLGNFINRALVFLSNNFNGIVPDMQLDSSDQVFIAQVNRELHTYMDLLEKLRLRDAIRHILNISRLGNQYVQSHKPWVLVKGSPEERARSGSVVGLCANVVCLLSIMVQPYMPAISRVIQNQLKVPESINVLPRNLPCALPAGHVLGKPSPLFQKLEPAQMEAFRKRFAGFQTSRETTPKPDTKGAGGQTANHIEKVAVDSEKVADLTQLVEKQGDVVRQLKSSKADKADIDREVAKLLELKLNLTVAAGKDPLEGANKKKKKRTARNQ